MSPSTVVWRRCLTGRPFDSLIPIFHNTFAKTTTTSQTIPLFLLPLHHHTLLLQTQQYQQTRDYNIKRRGTKNTERVLPTNSTSSPIPPEDTKYPTNEQITITECRLVDETGTFRGLQPVAQLFSTIDRSKFHLVQVNKAKYSDDGSTLLFPPTCRLIPIEIYNKTIAAPAKNTNNNSKLSASDKKRAEKLDPRKTVKELQLSWAITGNDLGHRMNKMKQFLAKGNRVEVMVAGKKGMRLVPREEMETVVEGVRNAVEEARAKEWKKASGEVGKSLMMYFQGPLDEKTERLLAQEDDDEEDDEIDGKGDEDKEEEQRNPLPNRIPRRRS